MKSFLMCSIIGMLAAGIYGTVDLTLDVKSGTLIQYEDGEEIPAVSQFAASTKGIFKRTNVKVAHIEKKQQPPPVLLNSFSDIELEDFSRGEPIPYELYLPGPSDSLETTDIANAINDTLAAVNEKVRADSVATKKEERKFSVKLYSRGKPRPVVKDEVALESDTAKTH